MGRIKWEESGLDNCCVYLGGERDDESLAFHYTSIGDCYCESVSFVDCIEGIACIQRCWGYDLDIGRLLMRPVIFDCHGDESFVFAACIHNNHNVDVPNVDAFSCFLP